MEKKDAKREPKKLDKKSVKKKETKTSKKTFFQEVREEMKKVKWPEKQEMIKYVTATLGFIILFGLYFYGLDVIFAWIKGIIS